MNIDFNLHCLPNMDFNFDDVSSAQKILANIKSCYITAAVLTPFFNPHNESVGSFLERRKNELSKLQARGIELIPAATVPCTNKISEIDGFCKLKVPNTKYIYLSLELVPDFSVLDQELHRVMHIHKLIPVFADFEVAMITYTKDQLYKILHIPYAIFQVNISSLSNDFVFRLVRDLISQNRCVIFGTGIKDYRNRIINYNLPTKKFEKYFGKYAFGYYMFKCEQLFR